MKFFSTKVVSALIAAGIMASAAMAISIELYGRHANMRDATHLKLTVLVDERKVSKVQVYRGLPEMDFRDHLVVFPRARLVDERAITARRENRDNGSSSEWWAASYTKLLFILQPGRYFVYPISNSEPGFQPVEVQLTRDMEIHANTLVPL